MEKQALKYLNKQLDELLRVHQVTISQPRQQMLQLDDVPVGAAFNRPMTNVLLSHDSPRGVWRVFVDEGLQYAGADSSRKRVFEGPQFQGWLRLKSKPVAGADVNDTIVWALNLLESDMRSLAPQELQRLFESVESAGFDSEGFENAVSESDKLPSDPLELLDSRVARIVGPADLDALSYEPTSAQTDAIILAAESVLRPVAPNCPLLMGRSGVGKTMVAKLAARELIRRGLVSRVVEISGAAICAGPIFLAERDERLRSIVDSLAQIGNVLVILEQFDAVLLKSPVAASILADALDGAGKIIAVARPEFTPDRLKRCSQLRRRIEPCVLQPPDYSDVADILRCRWAEHPLAKNLELSPNILPLVNQYSKRRCGANPASAIGLFEAVISRAAFSGRQCVGPDDVFHLVRHSDHS